LCANQPWVGMCVNILMTLNGVGWVNEKQVVLDSSSAQSKIICASKGPMTSRSLEVLRNFSRRYAETYSQYLRLGRHSSIFSRFKLGRKKSLSYNLTELLRDIVPQWSVDIPH